MSAKVVERLTWFIVGIGLAVTAGAYALHGSAACLSVAAGSAVALGNWFLLRFILARVIAGSMRNKAMFSGLVVVKMAALMILVFVLLHSHWVQPLPFTIGVSTLIVGSLLGSFVHVMTAPPAESKS